MAGLGSGSTLLPLSHILSAMLLICCLAGVIEDITKRVSVRIRFASAVASALMASFILGDTVNHFDIWGFDLILMWSPAAVLVTAVVVSDGINAVNIIDGFNGLAGTTVVIMLAALGSLGWIAGDHLVTELAVLGLSATIGFLLINYPAGRIFFGDGGFAKPVSVSAAYLSGKGQK